jgi:HK97 family phage major capsid protein
MNIRTAYKESFDDFGQFLAGVVRYGLDGSVGMDPRLEFQAIAGANSTYPSEGAFLVPPEFAEILWERTYTTGQILSRCTKQPMVTDSISLPAIDETSRAAGLRSGGVQMFWSESGDSAAATKPKFASLTLQPKKLLAFCYTTDELLADVRALPTWLLRVYGTESAFVVEDKIVSGAGTGTPLGILNSGALITVAGTLAQDAATVSAANLQAMDARLWPASHATAVWLFGLESYGQISGASFSNGAPVVDFDADEGPSILGKPLIITEATAPLGSAGDVILADMSQYLIADRETDFVNSIHVRYLSNENVFRFRLRLDGQSAWRGPVVPKNCTAQASPFIALQAR